MGFLTHILSPQIKDACLLFPSLSAPICVNLKIGRNIEYCSGAGTLASIDKAIADIIDYPNEERNIEFKSSVRWEGDIKVKITKSLMAMANLRDGGWIVIGKEEQPDRSFKTVGMNQEDFNSFDPDEVKAFVYSMVDPPVRFLIHKIEHNAKNFIVLRINEFDRTPIICKKSYGEIIHSGSIYVRSKGKPESIPVPSQNEMNEIIDLAIDKGFRDFLEKSIRRGTLKIGPIEISDDKEKFAKQIEELV